MAAGRSVFRRKTGAAPDAGAQTQTMALTLVGGVLNRSD